MARGQVAFIALRQIDVVSSRVSTLDSFRRSHFNKNNAVSVQAFLRKIKSIFKQLLLFLLLIH